MAQIARHSHYVPQAYLGGWSHDGGNSTHAYRLLVPHENYPPWEQRSIRGLLAFTDLYTSIGPGGGESDVFEQWVNREIETPAADALHRVRLDQRLTREQWRGLAMYVAALDLRTPTKYVEFMELYDRVLPEMLSRNLAESLAAADATRAAGKRLEALPVEADEIPFPVRVVTEKNEQGPGRIMRAEVTRGRQMWVHDMRHLLNGAARRLREHRWTILRPTWGLEWFTSDVPVLRLNNYQNGKYDFRGGWDNPGARIFVPLSPQHLLYTLVGSRPEIEGTLERNMTLKILALLAERASRWIIARRPSPEAERFRRRVVDLELFRDEGEAQRKWHETQSGAGSRRADLTIALERPAVQSAEQRPLASG